MVFICVWYLSFLNLLSIFLENFRLKMYEYFFYFLIYYVFMYCSINCYMLLYYVLVRFFFGINIEYIIYVYVDKCICI